MANSIFSDNPEIEISHKMDLWTMMFFAASLFYIFNRRKK